MHHKMVVVNMLAETVLWFANTATAADVGRVTTRRVEPQTGHRRHEGVKIVRGGQGGGMDEGLGGDGSVGHTAAGHAGAEHRSVAARIYLSLLASPSSHTTLWFSHHHR